MSAIWSHDEVPTRNGKIVRPGQGCRDTLMGLSQSIIIIILTQYVGCGIPVWRLATSKCIQIIFIDSLNEPIGFWVALLVKYR